MKKPIKQKKIVTAEMAAQSLPEELMKKLAKQFPMTLSELCANLSVYREERGYKAGLERGRSDGRHELRKEYREAAKKLSEIFPPDFPPPFFTKTRTVW